MAGMLGCGGGPEILFFVPLLWAGLEEAWAIIVINACLCNPVQDLPSKWSSTSSSLGCWWACSQTHLALIVAASVLMVASAGKFDT
jgi:hypothetical protein